MDRKSGFRIGFESRPGVRSGRAPALRLVGNRAEVPPSREKIEDVATPPAEPLQPAPPAKTVEPLTGPADPRWVLAVRTAEQLEGEVLRPEKRQRLMKLGRVLGLSPFDATLVIAIVQDQARRGYASEYCPTAAEPQLTMVRLPGASDGDSAVSRRRRVVTLCWVAVIVAVELILLWRLL